MGIAKEKVANRLLLDREHAARRILQDTAQALGSVEDDKAVASLDEVRDAVARRQSDVEVTRRRPVEI